MKILFTNDAPLIKYGIAKGFKKEGCQIKIFPLWKIDKNLQEEKLSQQVEEFNPDILFVEGHSGLNQESLFSCIDKMDLNMFYWAIEDPVHIDWISMPYAKHSKYIFTTAVECVEKYQKEGLRADTLLFACNPEFHRTVEPIEKYKYDIAFVGSNYDIRYDAARQIVIPLVKNGYNIKVWGMWWQDESRPVTVPDENYGGVLPYEELPALYSSAKICLGLHCDSSSKTQSSMRTYEVLGCGGFYLTQYTLAHRELFEYKKHLVWSRSEQDVLNMVNYYLKNDSERNEIAQSGQKFVYNKHTYQQRAKKVLKIAQKIL